MPLFPGTQQPTFEKVDTWEDQGYRVGETTINFHTGTHIDAPAHMVGDGPYLDNLDIGHFIGSAAVLDFSSRDIEVIDTDSLKPYEEKIESVEFLIVKTGWSRYWGDEKYYKDFPCLSEEAARWLSGFNLKGVGLDTISVDPIDSTTFAVHRILLSSGIIAIENLANLDSIVREKFVLSVLPLKIEDAEGSPVRAVAIEDI